MKLLLFAALLAFTPEEKPQTAAAVITRVAPDGALATDRGTTYRLAGVTALNQAKARPFLEKFVVNKPANLGLEPNGKAVHVFVSADCAELEAFMHGRSERAVGSCVKSVYVNKHLLEQKLAKPAPKGVTLYRDRLFGERQPAKRKR